MSRSNPLTSIYAIHNPQPPVNKAMATFQTHLNYVRRIELMTQDMTINIPRMDTGRLDSSHCVKFEKLAALTLGNIHTERDACLEEPAYSLIAAPWISAKCYYVLYYLESVFLFLLDNSTIGFRNGGHIGVRKAMSRHLKAGRFTLGGCTHADELATVVTWQVANTFSTTGSTISATYYHEPECNGSVRKKLADYIETDWKHGNNIKSYRPASARALKTSELHPKEFTLLDYFYWMRIKTHYRDLDFLDFENTIGEDEALTYTKCYVNAMDRYANALTESINTLKQSRGISTAGIV